MAVKIQLSGTYAEAMGSQTVVEAKAGKLRDIISEITQCYPKFKKIVCASDDSLMEYVEFRIFEPDGSGGHRLYDDVMDRKIADGSTLWFIDQLAGG